jgi:acetyl esterase/lipase
MNPHLPESIEQLYAPAAGLRIRPRTAGNYRRTGNHVYAEAHGIGLLYDVFAPEVQGNGLGIVDVISGAWHSDRHRLNEHIGLGIFDALCARGYTVFAVRPGSAAKFTARQMVRHVHAAIRHVKAHAGHYGIDPDRLGLVGASAGGHLAALAALHPEDPMPQSRHTYKQHGSAVRAVGLLFPPTDLVEFGEQGFDFATAEGQSIQRLLFEDGIAHHDRDAILAAAAEVSPARNVPRNPPPFLLIHGDADPVVPLAQSEKLAAALTQAGGQAELLIRPSGGHPWPDIRTEIEQLADWFGRQL